MLEWEREVEGADGWMVLEEEEVLGFGHGSILHSGQVAWRGVFTRLCRPETGMAVQQEGESKSGALTWLDLGRVCPRAPGQGLKSPSVCRPCPWGP